VPIDYSAHIPHALENLWHILIHRLTDSTQDIGNRSACIDNAKSSYGYVIAPNNSGKDERV